MKYFSLFSGIGGFELGIQEACLTNKFGQKANECVGYSEIDRYAITIYENHFNHINYGDIKTIDPAKLPDFDLLVGGFPCQSFSIAGLRRGFDDTRGTLFFDIARILREKRPKLFLLENVKGLLSHDGGRTFKTIVTTLTDLGYDLQWQVLNSKNHGVPQNRERIFIVGNLRGKPRPKVFPFYDADESRAEAGEAEKGIRETASTLTARQYTSWGGNFVKVGTYRTHKSGQGFREKKDGLVPTIPARAREDGSGQPVILQKSQDWREKGTLREFRNVAPTLRAKMGDNHPMIMQRGRGKNKGGEHKIAPTLTGSSYQDNNHVDSIRRLTPVECERLQGFPDNWTDRVSDTQRYKTLGNAVTVNVIRDICKRMLK